MGSSTLWHFAIFSFRALTTWKSGGCQDDVVAMRNYGKDAPESTVPDDATSVAETERDYIHDMLEAEKLGRKPKYQGDRGGPKVKPGTALHYAFTGDFFGWTMKYRNARVR